MIESNNPLFEVDVENYNGPLDVLLDLAKAQKVNLEEISITKLADQFHNYISNKKDLNLEVPIGFAVDPIFQLVFHRGLAQIQVFGVTHLQIG